MKISVSKIRDVADLAFLHLEERGIAEVDVPNILYWVISGEERFSVGDAPVEVSIGSLSDDYSDLARVLSGEQEILAMHMEQLGVLLSALGTILGSELAARGG